MSPGVIFVPWSQSQFQPLIPNSARAFWGTHDMVRMTIARCSVELDWVLVGKRLLCDCVLPANYVGVHRALVDSHWFLQGPEFHPNYVGFHQSRKFDRRMILPSNVPIVLEIW